MAMFSIFTYMKYLLALLCFTACFCFEASAQTDSTKKITTADFTKPVPSKTIAAEVGHVVAVCDTVVDYRVVSDALTLLNLGSRYPNQNITIALKGPKVNPALMKGKAVCFYGEITLFKNKPEMVITQPVQIMDIQKYQ
jgi:DNA/RNA endonuclease YhcR with UshA esterase domain